MQFTLEKNENCKQRWKDQNKKSWPYITAKDAENLELDMSKVIADVGDEKDNNGNSLNFLGRTVFLKEKMERVPVTKKIIGYMPCKDENGELFYVRILGKKRNIYIIPLVLLSLLLVGSLVFWYMNNDDSGIDLDKDAISYQMPNGAKNENPDEIMIPVFTALTIEKGEDVVKAGFVNPEGNPCYFKYSVYLKDGNKKLYQSKWLKPGTAVTEFELNEDFKKGEYPILIKITTGSLSDPDVEMNGGEIDSLLVVK